MSVFDVAKEAKLDAIGRVHKHVSVPVVVDGATGVGFGSAVLEPLPVGKILGLATVATITVTAGESGMTATWQGDVSLGTTAADDGTLTAGDVDIIASTALGAATAGVSPTVSAENATPAIIDNSAGDLAVRINLLVDDAAIDEDGVECVVDVEIGMAYVQLTG